MAPALVANGARLALWVIPNLEFFHLGTPLAGHPWEKASEYKAPTVRASSWAKPQIAK